MECLVLGHLLRVVHFARFEQHGVFLGNFQNCIWLALTIAVIFQIEHVAEKLQSKTNCINLSCCFHHFRRNDLQ